MHKIRVGVIRGGQSKEYESSLKTGANVLKNLSIEKYHSKDILIDRSGQWFMNGFTITPHDALTHIDVAFNALHGYFGEDGKIQHIFEVHGIPFTGSGSFASAIGMNKALSKEVYKKEKIKTPKSEILESHQDISKAAHSIFKIFSLPIVVKPTSGSASEGITIINSFIEFEQSVRKAFEYSDSVLIEEFIKGREATCGIIENFRDSKYYTLPTVEIYLNTEAMVPSNFSEEDKREIEGLAILAHKALGLRHYSRSDFIIHPKRGIFIIETNTLPKITEKSLFQKALHSVGATTSHFIDHIIQLALSGK